MEGFVDKQTNILATWKWSLHRHQWKRVDALRYYREVETDRFSWFISFCSNLVSKCRGK